MDEEDGEVDGDAKLGHIVGCRVLTGFEIEARELFSAHAVSIIWWGFQKNGFQKTRKYRVSQKKLSLVEIGCGKYNSNIGEKSSRSFDKLW